MLLLFRRRSTSSVLATVRARIPASGGVAMKPQRAPSISVAARVAPNEPAASRSKVTSSARRRST